MLILSLDLLEQTSNLEERDNLRGLCTWVCRWLDVDGETESPEDIPDSQPPILSPGCHGRLALGLGEGCAGRGEVPPS